MKLLVSTIEPSSTKYLKEIYSYFDKKDVELVGIGDKSIVKNSIYQLEQFSVMGIMSVLPKIFFFKKAIKEVVQLSKDVDAVLLIDAPSFNLRIAKGIKEKYPHIVVIYYILPKIWAWKPKRLELVEKYTNYHISILPFEDKFYKNALYFGNPLHDEYENINIDFDKNEYIAFLPGSRKSEIQSLMPVFKEVAKNINKKAIVVIPDIFDKEYINKIYKNLDNFKIMSNTKDALSVSSFAFICSGTATYEATLMKIPFILTYIPNKIDWFIYNVVNTFKQSGLSSIGYIGLANIISYFANKKPIHQEIFPKVTKDMLLFSYKNFDYNLYKKNTNDFKKTIKHTNSLKQVSNFIYKVMKNEL